MLSDHFSSILNSNTVLKGAVSLARDGKGHTIEIHRHLEKKGYMVQTSECGVYGLVILYA